MKKAEFTDCDAYSVWIATLRPFLKETLKSHCDYYRMELTYTSNALEGNSLRRVGRRWLLGTGSPSAANCARPSARYKEVDGA